PGEAAHVFLHRNKAECPGTRRGEIERPRQRLFKNLPGKLPVPFMDASSERRTQCPKGAAMAVFGPARFEPAPVVTHEVSKILRFRIERVPEEGQVRRRQILPRSAPPIPGFFQKN